MAATAEQIAVYLLTLTDAQSDYGRKVAKECRIGKSDTKNDFIKLTLLSYYIRSLEKYFDTTDYENNNFFTTTEAKDIMERINGICGTFHYLEI